MEDASAKERSRCSTLMKYVWKSTVSRVSGSITRQSRDRYACMKEAAGFEPEEELRLKGSLEQASLSPDRAQLLELAVSHRPDLAAQRANESIATAGLRQLQAEAKPDASFSASYERPTADSHSPPSTQRETFSPSAKLLTTPSSGFAGPCLSSTGTRVRSSRQKPISIRRVIRSQPWTSHSGTRSHRVLFGIKRRRNE